MFKRNPRAGCMAVALLLRCSNEIYFSAREEISQIRPADFENIQ